MTDVTTIEFEQSMALEAASILLELISDPKAGVRGAARTVEGMRLVAIAGLAESYPDGAPAYIITATLGSFIERFLETLIPIQHRDSMVQMLINGLQKLVIEDGKPDQPN